MQATSHLPRPVYETLPKLYMAGGVATFIALPVGIATVSGTLLLATGAWIAFVRRYSRKHPTSRSSRSSRASGATARGARRH